jgi:hypothetical protein
MTGFDPKAAVAGGQRDMKQPIASPRIGDHVLAYNLKRMIAILGPQLLIAAIRA